jgi:hypothetical protein
MVTSNEIGPARTSSEYGLGQTVDDLGRFRCAEFGEVLHYHELATGMGKGAYVARPIPDLWCPTQVKEDLPAMVGLAIAGRARQHNRTRRRLGG